MPNSTYLDRSIILSHPRQNKVFGVNSGGASYTGGNRLQWETFVVELAGDDDLVFLRSDHGTLLSSRPDGVVLATASRGAAEQWRIAPISNSELVLVKSVATGMHLSLGDNGVPVTTAQANSDATQWRVEEASAALKFDGASAHATLPAQNPDFSQGLTIEAWVRYDGLANYSRVLDLGNGPASDNILLTNIGTSPDLSFHVFQGSTGQSLTAPGALTLNTWTHVAATLDASGRARLYKNGVQIAEGPVQLPRNVQREKNYIGRSNWAVDALLNGQLAEVRLWTCARTQAQIASAMGRRLHGDEAGLTGYWRFDATAGLLARDESGNNRHAAITGEAVWVRAGYTGLTLDPPAEEIKVSTFAGNGQVRLPAMHLDFSAGCTVEAWIRPQSLPVWSRIFEMSEGQEHVALLANDQGKLGIVARTSDDANVSKYAATALPVGRWTHVCGVLDPAGEARLYADGKLVASGPAQVPKNIARANCQIGNSPRNEGFNGMIAELRLWTCVRSEAQIVAAMRRGLTGHERGLAGYWRLDEDSGASARDRSTNGRTGTRAGGCAQTLAHLPVETLRSRVTTVTHEGKVVVFATRPDGRVQYTVKQSGFEDTVPITQGVVPGWELWKDLELPDQPDDPSVLAREAKTLTYDNDTSRYVLRSRYRTADQTALAPVQVVSGFGHLHVFRQSSSGTLLLDRFVLDGIQNVLVPKVEVRFKRSRKRHEPLLPASRQATDQTFDSLDFSDTAGAPFYEPSTELCLVDGVHDGLFAVVLLPTRDADRQRWHFFSHNAATHKVEVVSILSSDTGLFDPLQRTSSADGSLLPGIERTQLDLGLAQQGLARSLCAVRYDLQEEQANAHGERLLLRTAVRVMLVVEAAQGANVISFAAALDGTLSRIEARPTAEEIVHSERRELLLPLDTLENVQAAQVNQPVAGAIDAMRRGSGDKVSVQSSTAGKLKIGDSVEVKGTQQYNGRYTVRVVNGDTFEIDVAFTDPVSGMGKWEKVSSRETGLVFDGAVTSYSRTPGGKLLVTAPNHGLVVNDAVQITGTSDYNSVYPVTPVDAGQFTIEAPWILGSALGVQRLASRKRRGIVLNGVDEYIAVRDARVPTGAASYTIEAWIRPREMTAGGIVGWGNELANDQSNSLALTATGLVHRWGNNDLAVATAPLTDGWHHVAASYDGSDRKRRIFLDGAEIASDEPVTPHAVPQPVTNFTIGRARGEHFKGTLADVRVWSVAHRAQQIAGTMFEPLSGQEDGLCGYWKLGALAESDAAAWGLGFDGTGSYAYVPDAAALRIPQYTVELWIKPEVPTQEWTGLVGKPGRNYNIWLHRSGKIHHQFHTNAKTNDGAPDTPADTIRWGEWNHIAITNDGQTARTFHDGIERASVSLAGKTLIVDNTPLIIGRDLDGNIANYYRGTLDELRLWSRARTGAEIAAHRGRGLVGDETDLVAYWRCGDGSGAGLVDATARRLDAIVAGGAAPVVSDAPITPSSPVRVHRVFDFSPNRSDGVAVGTPHVANVTLAKVANAQYRNDDMIAVVRGGVYEESVELRADSGAAPAFKFSHWFKKSSDSPTPDATLAPIDAKLTAIGGGWYRATCQFAVPATTSLMRSFKIVDVADGPWTTLELRRHRLVELPAAITQWTYTAAPTLPAASSAPPDLDVQLAALAQNERSEAALLLEKRILEDKIAASVDPNLSARIDALNAAITALLAQQTTLTNRRAQHLQRPMLFCCRYTPRHSGMALAIENSGQGHGPRLRQVHYTGADNQQFFADPGILAGQGLQTPNNYLLRPKHSGLFVDVENWSEDNGASLHQWIYTGHNNQWFGFEPVPGVADTYKLRSRHSGRLVDVYRGTNNVNEGVIQFHENGDTNQHFKIERMSESPITQPVLDELNECVRTLATRQQELALLTQARQAGADQRGRWQTRLNVIDNTLLPPLRAAIATTNKQTLEAIERDQNKLPGLPRQIPEPARKLVTLVGKLPFIRSAGRITALQTCDGDVQLNYVDSRGRLREARYAATRGSGSASSDTWRPTAARAGLHVRGAGDMVRFNRPVALGDDWSVEAWFQFPLPKVGYCNTLVGRAGPGELLIRDNRLGAWLDGFHDCGFDVTVLSHDWHHLAVVGSGSGATSTISFFVDGKRVGDLRSTAIHRAGGDKARLDAIKAMNLKPSFDVTSFGNHLGGGKHFGRVAELRLWGLALKDDEVAANSRALLTGREPGLVAYYPMTDARSGELRDVTGNGNHGTIVGEDLWIALDAPVGRSPGEARGHAVAVAEYDTIGQRPGSTAMMALMRRATALETPRGVRLVSEQRVEELDLRWVGNAQFQPTLLGFIEGPPPVPSENLTLSPNYNGAASVELSTSDDVNFQWNRAKDEKFGSTSDFFIGADLTKDWLTLVTLIAGFNTDLAKLRLGVKGGVSGSTGTTRSSTIGSQSSLKMTDRLELRGTLEDQPRFPQLGSRFIPKNVGYALVVSGLADVFVTSLKRSGKMVGYDVVPNPDIPPDVNTVSFLINPAYTMTGSLDGMTGSKATSERFFGHVPELRAQYGSRYPASYYRLKEAYDLKQQIAEQDRNREAYFFNFDARITTLGEAGDDELARQIDKGDAPSAIVVRRPESQPPANAAADAANAQDDLIDSASADQDANAERAAQRRAQIEKSFADREDLHNATRGLDKWQQRMEDLRIRAGKRNIVNTYVWDSNGGLHTEQQQFASSIQHSVGSNASVSFNVGLEFKMFVGGFGVELTSMFNMSMSQTLTKTVSTSRGFGLGVSLAGMESRGVTDHKDRPIVPGEKVGRYRFMSFYLEGATQHFDDFFAYVVDPEWLIGNSENARALRETRGRTNKAWRVLHRVTYVERPALANFGADLRPLPAAPAAPSIEKRVDGVEQKLDLVLKLLQAPKTP